MTSSSLIQSNNQDREVSRQALEQWRERLKELHSEMLEIEREFLSLVEEQSLYKADPRNERFLDKEIWEAKDKVGHDAGVEVKEGGRSGRGASSAF